MGNAPPGGAPGAGAPGGDPNKKKDEDKDKKKKEMLAPPSHFGRKKRKQKGVSASNKLPNVFPNSKCRLRLLKHERIKDYLMMEEEFIREQQRLKQEKHGEVKLKSRFLQEEGVCFESTLIRMLEMDTSLW